MTTRQVEHDIQVDAPAQAVYQLIAQVENWPRIFPPTIHVDREDLGEGQERIHISATANGQPKNWTSHRDLDPQALRIGFRQEIPAPPVAAMAGTWIIEPLGAEQCKVRLLHDYRAIDDDPHDLLWIDEAVDRNSRSELAGLKRNVEFAHAAEAATFSFEDTVEIAAKPDEVYDFIDRADLWAERLPHVAAVRLTEDTPHLQTLEMDTRAKDGSTHTTKSHRVTTPGQRIAYKQVTLPALLALHTGRWTFTPTPDGTTTATSQHTVTINTDRITDILGPHATLHDARTYVHDALSTNSRATLHHAKAFTEGDPRS
ncbi:aromatase/cyclase [Streptomyces sp. TLI_171]|uniref:aromatase/cyclase n=1 Tax=Streptomyces sp. TLI_171 TaxID=1938859 RepID=UPI000C19ED14|nr:aromatase/cyclase [Streptomyces sp. TLI_171]RKE19895.1 aromatase [Streptomyces sp. TLI_171]